MRPFWVPEQLQKSLDDALAVRVDSFVVETDVHFPTDLNRLADAVRKALETSAGASRPPSATGAKALTICLKQAFRRVQQLKRSTSQDEAKREARQGEIQQACRDSPSRSWSVRA